MTTTMTQKAQVTIPKAVRDKVGIQPGDKVSVSAGDRGEILLRRAHGGSDDADTAGSWLDGALETIRARRRMRPRFTTDEIMRMTRGED